MIEKAFLVIFKTYYRVERESGRKRLRPPLSAVKGVSASLCREIMLKRLAAGSFSSIAELYERVAIAKDALEALAKAEAFDRLQERREVLYQIQALSNTQSAGVKPLFSGLPESPALPELKFSERVVWDYAGKGFNEHELHPIDLIRQQLLELGATPMKLSFELSNLIGSVAVVVDSLPDPPLDLLLPIKSVAKLFEQ